LSYHSRQHLRHDFARHVGQAEVAALITVGEMFVIEAEEMKNRRVEIVDVDRLFRDAPADFVRLADDLSALHPAARHPDAVGKGMMIAPAHAAGEGRSVLAQGS